MRTEEAHLVRAKQKSSMVKNVKEHMATERELQNTRKLAQEREEEVLKLIEAVETAKKSIAQHETDLDREAVAAETRGLDVQHRGHEAQVRFRRGGNERHVRRIVAMGSGFPR